MTKAVEIRLAEGDVTRLGVVRESGRVRLLVYDDVAPVPLVQAILSDDERDALVVALQSDGEPTPGNA